MSGVAVACTPENVSGLTVTCSGDGGADVVIGSNFSTELSTGFSVDGPLTVFNAGVIDVPGGQALWLVAPSISYTGTGGLIRTPFDTALAVRSAGDIDLLIEHDIDGFFGVQVEGDGPSVDRTINIVVGAGEITGSSSGIRVVQQDNDFTTVTIANGASVISPAGVSVMFGRAKVVLGGTLDGENQASAVWTNDDELELHPGFVMTGTFDASEGEDTLTFGGGGTGTFDLGRIGPDFLSFEQFGKTGSSTWTLHGEATQAFDLDITSGEVVFDGTLLEPSTFTVGFGSRLSGAGMFEEALPDIFVHGTLAPGSGKGRTFFAKDVYFDATSTLEIETSAADGDRLDVRSAELDGRVLVIPDLDSQSTYDILFSDTPLIGTFSAIESKSDLFEPTLEYFDDRVVLHLAATGITVSSYAKTPAQAAVASLLDAMGEDSPYYRQIFSMGSDAASEFLEQLSGSGFAATGAALLQNAGSLNTAVLGRIQQQSGALGPNTEPLGYSTFSTGDAIDGLSPSVWGKLVAGTSSMGGASAGSAALIGGIDVELGDEWTLGLLAGIGSSSIVSGNATVQSVDLSAGFYGAKEFDAVAIRFGGSLTHHAASSSRRLVAPGVKETLVASYGALTAQTFAELAYGFELGLLGAELFGGIGYARHFSPGFTETGGAGALTVAAAGSDAVETTVGARVSQDFALGTTLMTLGGSVGWRHRFVATPSTTNSFGGGTPFETAGVSTAGSALVARADVRLDLSERSGLDLAYDLEWGSTGVAHAISARYAMSF